MSQIKTAFDLGLKKMQAEHDALEGTKLGVLRAGNAGILTDKGFVGKCPRISYLRFKGIKVEEHDDNKEHMFAAGRSNEDIWLDKLKRGWSGKILREEEIPTKWFTDVTGADGQGVAVTGRPDIMLCDDAGVPKVGIELKLVSSVNTAKTVLFQKQPKLEHVIQAVHYSWQHNVPFEIWYTSTVNWHPTDWLKKALPNSMSESWSDFANSGNIEIGYYKNILSKNGNKYQKAINQDEFLKGNHGKDPGQVIAGVKKILPFTVGYELKITNSAVYYRLAGTKNEWSETPVSVSGIKNYYNFIAKMDVSDELPGAPINIDITGEKLPWDPALYCPLGELCCGDKSGEKSVKNWLIKVNKVLKFD